MKLDEARNVIYQRFKDQWGTTTKFTCDNEKFQQPPSPDTPWLRLVVRNIGGGQNTIGQKGDRRFRRKGLILIQVFTPVGKGLKSSDVYVEMLREIFEGESFGDRIDCGNADTREKGEDGEHLQTNVEIVFDYDDIK